MQNLLLVQQKKQDHIYAVSPILGVINIHIVYYINVKPRKFFGAFNIKYFCKDSFVYISERSLSF